MITCYECPASGELSIVSGNPRHMTHKLSGTYRWTSSAYRTICRAGRCLTRLRDREEQLRRPAGAYLNASDIPSQAQSTRPIQAPAARIFHFSHSDPAPGIFHLCYQTEPQPFISRIHLDNYSSDQFVTTRVFRSHSGNSAPGFFHINHHPL